MRAVKRANTTPEIAVRKLLHSKGFRYRLHRRDLPGSPDITLPKYNTIIFVHGCFWHKHENCKFATIPKTRQEYWIPKLLANRERDKRNEQSLKELGWRVIVIWECETKNKEALDQRLDTELKMQDQE